MLVMKAYKFRIYPTKEQEIIIAKTIGCSRFVFNCDGMIDSKKRVKGFNTILVLLN